MKGLLRYSALAAAALPFSACFAGNSVTIPNGTGSVDYFGEPSNVIVHKTMTSSFLVGDQISIISGTLVEQTGHTATWAEDAWIAMSSPEHPGLFAFVEPSVAGDYTGSLNLTPGAVTMFGTLIGTNIANGEHMDFEFFEGYDDGAAGQAEQVWNNLVFTIDAHLPTPPTAENLGTIAGNLTRTHTFGASEVYWYKFTTSAPTDASTFLSLSTGSTTAFLGGEFGDNDTEIAIYSQYGSWLYQNDDEDFANDILTSKLSFGQGGIDGDLPAGTYYLAVGGWNSTFNDGFGASSTSTATGPVVLTVNSNFTAGTCVSGTVTLQDLSISPAGQQITWEVLNAGTPVASGTAVLNGSGQYSFMTTATGTKTVRIKGATWLAQGSGAVSLSGTPVTGLNFSLKNGDCDGDNEVALADFGILSSAFGTFLGDPGFTAAADLDKDGEVGLADFGILSSNFGELGD